MKQKYFFVILIGMVMIILSNSIEIKAIAFNSTENISNGFVVSSRISIDEIDVNTNNGLVYIGGRSGNFGVYNFTSNYSINLSNLLDYWWTFPVDQRPHIRTIIVVNNTLVYIGGESQVGGSGSNIRFGYYNETCNCSVSLQGSIDTDEDGITPFMNDGSILSFEYNKDNGLLYIGGAFGTTNRGSSLGVYNSTSNKTTRLYETINNSFSRPSIIRAMVYDPISKLLFLCGVSSGVSNIGSIFASYNITTNNTINLSSKMPNINKSNVITSLALDEDNRLIYIGLSDLNSGEQEDSGGNKDGKFWVYNITSNTTTNLSATIPESNQNDFDEMRFDKNKKRLYFSTNQQRWGYYDYKNNITVSLNGTGVNNFMSGSSSLGLGFDLIINKIIYIGGSIGRLGAYPSNVIPNATNISITPLPISIGGVLTGHCLYNDSDNDVSGGNQTYWYINKSIINEANNSFSLLGGNSTNNANITFSCRFNDTYEWGNWINSSTATVGDTIAPTITAQSLNSNSFITTDIFNLTTNCTDAGVINYARAEINASNNTMSSLGNNIFSLSGQANSLFPVGVRNVTNIYCADGSGNIARDISNFTFTISNPPSPGISGGTSGGGGGAVATTIIIKQGIPFLTFGGLTLIDFNVINVPSKKTKVVRFKNVGNTTFENADVFVVGDAKKYINPFICDIDLQKCINKSINIKAGESKLLILNGTFTENLGAGTNGLIRIQEQKEKGNTYELNLIITRPPLYKLILPLKAQFPDIPEFILLIGLYLGIIGGGFITIIIISSL